MPLTRATGSSIDHRNIESDEEELNDDENETYYFNGTTYDTYQEYCDAKRQRNTDVLMKSGLLGASQNFRNVIDDEKSKKGASQRGLGKNKRKKTDPQLLPRRKSSRLSGVKADGIYVEDEKGGKFIFNTPKGSRSNDAVSVTPEEPTHFRGRINDGSALSVKEAVETSEPKWVKEDSVESAAKFVSDTLTNLINENEVDRARNSPNRQGPEDIDSLTSKVDSLSVDDETCVAKVTPDRIYSISCHPSADSLVVGAGDKQGYVGLWHVDSAENDDSTNGVHLFRVHDRPVCCLDWTPSGNALLSASYDGTVRWFDVAKGSFTQIFATYDDSLKYRSELGRGLDEGYNYWVQYVTQDHRNLSEQCFFASTSAGTAMHVDLRVGKNCITSHEVLSEKKINTLSFHPNGNTLATAGLDCTVKLWDVRKLGDNRSSKKHTNPTPLATIRSPKSINSAFFSPSGTSLLSTTMSNTLDIVVDAHLQTKNAKVQPTKKIRHDNHTGRWLTTFMAKWHPEKDIFVVGSMQRPRTIELFDGQGTLLRGVQGDALTAVASRCCFHPSQDRLVVVGGNSSGRVTVVS